jgi:peptidoglycan hydrolase CwlO-like protein
MRNEWRKDIQYTRALVNAEYMIQTEFKIDGGAGEEVIEDTRTKDQKKIDKLEKKKQKIQDKIDKLNGGKQPKEIN